MTAAGMNKNIAMKVGFHEILAPEKRSQVRHNSKELLLV